MNKKMQIESKLWLSRICISPSEGRYIWGYRLIRGYRGTYRFIDGFVRLHREIGGHERI